MSKRQIKTEPKRKDQSKDTTENTKQARQGQGSAIAIWCKPGPRPRLGGSRGTRTSVKEAHEIHGNANVFQASTAKKCVPLLKLRKELKTNFSHLAPIL